MTPKLWIALAAMAALSVCAPSFAAPAFSMEALKDSCGDTARPYVSCVDQTQIYENGLAAARTQHKPAAVLLGYNDCPPCNALQAWLETAAGKAAFAPYVLVEVSIFDPTHQLRPEVYDKIIAPLHLGVARQPPYGVPHLVIVDPKTRKPLDHGMIGFNSRNPGATIEYLQSHAKRS